MASDQAGIGTRTLRGMFWAYGAYVGGKLLVLVSIAILARLLTPEDFGLVAFALTVTVLLDAISDLGVSQALIIVDEDEVYEKANTAWTIGVLLGALLMLITAALGPAAAGFFGEEELKIMLPLLGVNLLLRSAGVTHEALIEKRLEFRKRTIAQTADVVIRGGVGIGLALAGAGAYSLIGGYLAGTAALTISLWLLLKWRPSPRIRRADLGVLLRFGGGLTLLGLISVVVSNIDYVAIGRVLGATDLGFYTLGWRLPELMIVNLAVVAGLVLFPSFATIEGPARGAAYKTALRYVLMVSLPMAIGLCILAEPFVLTLFGDQWQDTVPVMQVLTAFAFFEALGIPGGIVYKSIGRIDVLIKIAIPQAILAVVSILIFVDDGIVAVAACQAGASAAGAVLKTFIAARLVGDGVRGLWAAAAPCFAAGAVLAAVLALVSAAVDGSVLTLLLSGAAGAVAYVGMLWLVAPAALTKLWDMAANRKPQPAEAGSG